jgi:hypothetical protein
VDVGFEGNAFRRDPRFAPVEITEGDSALGDLGLQTLPTDERDSVTVAGEPTADVAADRARAEDADLQRWPPAACQISLRSAVKKYGQKNR